MAYVKPADRLKGAGPGEEGEAAPIHRIRITLTSTATKSLEKGRHAWCARSRPASPDNLAGGPVSEAPRPALLLLPTSSSLQAKGPIRMPTRRLVHTTRRAPSANSCPSPACSYEMRIHKRLIDLHSPAEVVKQITSISVEPGVDVEVTIADV
ncbi:hypothetical protein ABPG75_010996 [Micractinium tetrahymenae]